MEGGFSDQKESPEQINGQKITQNGHEESKASSQPNGKKKDNQEADEALSETSEVEMIELDDDEEDLDNAEMTQELPEEEGNEEGNEESQHEEATSQ